MTFALTVALHQQIALRITPRFLDGHQTIKYVRVAWTILSLRSRQPQRYILSDMYFISEICFRSSVQYSVYPLLMSLRADECVCRVCEWKSCYTIDGLLVSHLAFNSMRSCEWQKV